MKGRRESLVGIACCKGGRILRCEWSHVHRVQSNRGYAERIRPARLAIGFVCLCQIVSVSRGNLEAADGVHTVRLDVAYASVTTGLVGLLNSRARWSRRHPIISIATTIQQTCPVCLYGAQPVENC